MKLSARLFVIVLFGGLYHVTSCPTGCSCDLPTPGAVNCISSTDILERVPSPLPDGTNELNIRFQNISRITKGDLPTELSSLRHLNLNNSNLQTIDDGSFENLTNLISLGLCGNAILEINEHTFVGLGQLVSLSLFDNEKLVMMPCSLSSLSSLHELFIDRTNVSFRSSLFTSTKCNVQSKSFFHLQTLFVGNVGVWIDADDLINLQHLTDLMLYYPLQPLLLEYNISSLVSLVTLRLHGLGFFPMAFLHHEDLKELYIYSSSFTYLPENAFANVPAVELIEASDGNLTFVNKDAFRGGLSSLRYLSLSGNNIHSIPSGLFAGITLRALWLQNNPLVCDCASLTWLSDVPVDQIYGECDSPAVFSGTQLHLIDASEMSPCDVITTAPDETTEDMSPGGDIRESGNASSCYIPYSSFILFICVCFLGGIAIIVGCVFANVKEYNRRDQIAQMRKDGAILNSFNSISLSSGKPEPTHV